MTVQVRPKVKSIMWQSVGEVVLVDVEKQRVYIEFEESSRHNGWFDVSELVLLTNSESSSLSTEGFSHA